MAFPPKKPARGGLPGFLQKGVEETAPPVGKKKKGFPPKKKSAVPPEAEQNIDGPPSRFMGSGRN